MTEEMNVKSIVDLVKINNREKIAVIFKSKMCIFANDYMKKIAKELNEKYKINVKFFFEGEIFNYFKKYDNNTDVELFYSDDYSKAVWHKKINRFEKEGRFIQTIFN